MVRFRDWLEGLKQHHLSRNASWIFLGQGSNLFLQAGSFILLAQLLGVKEYGLFAGTFAFVNMVTPYSALGAGMLFMRYVSADRAQAAVYWGNSLAVTSVATVLIACALFFVGPVLTKTPSHLIFVVLVVANCLFSQIASLAGQVFQTFEKMRSLAILSTVSNLARVIILITMRVTMHRATALEWSLGVLIASASAAGLAIGWVRAEIGPASWQLNLMLRRVREGVGFSFAGTTQASYNDVDKVMLSHYGLNRENGFYTLAYRVIDFATTPIIALESAVLPRFFRFGGEKMPDSVRLAVKSAVASVLFGVLIAGGVLLIAPIIPHLVGTDFSDVLTALRWLCCIPLLRGIHRMTGSALTGSGRQSFRTVAQVTVAVVNLALNLWLIPVYGWIGAAWSSVASDGLLAVLNSLILIGVWKRTSRPLTNALIEGEAY
jgi:O-antigen/teichoic acid export membrane protein